MGLASLVWILVLLVIIAGVVITVRAQRSSGPTPGDQQPGPGPQASPGPPAVPQQYSPDGRWWWDGGRWLPVPPSQQQHQQPPPSGRQGPGGDA